MKKRIFSLLLILALLLQLLVLPTSAATKKDVYQFLTGFVKQYGTYYAEDHFYQIAFDALDENAQIYYVIGYDADASELLLYLDRLDYAAMIVLTPSMSVPYEGYCYALNAPQDCYAVYSIDPKGVNYGCAYRHTDFKGTDSYRNAVDSAYGISMNILLEKTDNLLKLHSNGMSLKDLGFTSWNYHSIHEWGDAYFKEAKCGEYTVYERKCMLCDAVYTIVDAYEHDWGDVQVDAEPTCTASGLGYQVCRRCGARSAVSVPIPALGHAWQITEVLTPGSANAHGQAAYTCSRCGETFTGELCGRQLFQDMPAADHWAHFGIDWALEHGITNGVSATSFAPDRPCTRAQVVTFLWRAAGSPEPEGSKTVDFTDVKEGAYYQKAVQWAVEQEITNGTSAATFSPDSTCTRAQIVTFLWRYCGKPEPEDDKTSFTDVAAGSYYAKAVSWALKNQITTGTSPTTFSPDSTCTRAQVVVFLHRQSMYAPRTEEPEPDPDPDPDPDPNPDPDPDPDPDPEPGTKNLMKGYVSKLEEAPGAITDEAADAMADFTLDLFRSAEKPGESTILSPASVLCALAMLANGAQGETKAQLEQAFGMPVPELNEALRSYIYNMPDKSGETETNLANSVWVRDGFRVRSQFLQDNADYLSAGVFQAPFDDSTVNDINNWISENTDGMIPRLISELSPDTVLALVNALYLKAKWTNPYSDTVEMPFYRADGTAQKAEMLSSREHTYLHDENAAGFIKYFSGGKYAFAVVVPNEGVDLDDYIAGLDGAELRKLLQGERYDAVYAKMPKFKQETFVDLAEPLAAMGIRDAFDPMRADLSGIADDLVVSQAKHKAVIDVNEKGVSAAAATIIAVDGATAAPGENQKIAYVTADRPYLYMIIDKTTNLPLFIGTTTRTNGETITNPIPEPEPVVPTPVPMRTVDLTEGYTCQVAEAPGAISDEAADAMADFTMNMLRAAGDPQENTVLSPLSALYALDMLGNGARGRTREQLEQTFGLPVSELNKTLRSVTANLPDRNGSTKVHLSNSIWVHTGFEVEPQFLQDNADYLDAGAFQAPFDEQTLRDINNWISEQTEGMIPEMLDELSPDTMVALINALYFCGQWAEPYQIVTSEPFYPAGGGVQTAEMMHSTERIYLKDAQAQGFVKTFNSDKYAFAVVVPNKGVSLDEYIAELDGKRLRRLLKGVDAGEVNAAMPKFSAETFADLNEPLQAMGIRDAFIPGVADLSGIAPDLYVSKSLQKAVIEVDEKGVSAAAATVITLEKNASPSHATVTVTADRPYLYMIIDRTTNLPLFIGYNRTME